MLEEIIRAGRPAEISVSVLGVREGLLYEMLTPKARALDPLIEAADEFNTLRSRAPPHARELRAWTDRFVETAGLPETADDAATATPRASSPTSAGGRARTTAASRAST